MFVLFVLFLKLFTWKRLGNLPVLKGKNEIPFLLKKLFNLEKAIIACEISRQKPLTEGSKIQNEKYHVQRSEKVHRKVLLGGFHLNGHTLGFHHSIIRTTLNSWLRSKHRKALSIAFICAVTPCVEFRYTTLKSAAYCR